MENDSNNNEDINYVKNTGKKIIITSIIMMILCLFNIIPEIINYVNGIRTIGFQGMPFWVGIILIVSFFMSFNLILINYFRSKFIVMSLFGIISAILGIIMCINSMSIAIMK